VPFRIQGIKEDFSLQFDLGATCSMLYGNSIDWFVQRNAALAAKLDTTKRFPLEGAMRGGFRNLPVQISGQGYMIDDMAYFDGYGDTLTADSFKVKKVYMIGTLGAPFFKDKVLIIDYPRHRFLVLEKLEAAAHAKFEWVDSRLDDGRLKIPFTIDGKTYWMMFDTGASVLPIMTNEKYYHEFTGATPVDTLEITSWGKKIKSYGKLLDKSISLGSTPLSQQMVYEMPGNNWDDMFTQERITGLTGNTYFFDNIIAIDFSNKKFGIYKSSRP
jgi:hypothetical protein